MITGQLTDCQLMGWPACRLVNWQYAQLAYAAANNSYSNLLV